MTPKRALFLSILLWSGVVRGLLTNPSTAQDPRKSQVSVEKQVTLEQIHATIKQEVLPQWQCQERKPNELICANPQQVAGTFVIKSKANLIPQTRTIKDFMITATNSKDAIAAKGALGFHGTYRLRIAANSDPQVIITKIKALLGKAGIDGSDNNLILDIAKKGFVNFGEFVKTPPVVELIDELLENPTTTRSATAVFSFGTCKSSADLPCSFILYPVSTVMGGAFLVVGSRQIRSQFPSFNIQDNFRAFKTSLVAEFQAALAKETEAAALSFPEFRQTVAEQIAPLCNNCEVGKSATPAAEIDKIFDVKFDLPGKDEVEQDEKLTILDVAIPSRVVAFYLSFGRGKVAHLLFDNERVQTETLLPIESKNFATTLTAEATHFIELSKTDPENERREAYLTLAGLKTKMEELKDKCPEGALTDSANPKLSFFFSCGGRKVLQVTEVAVAGTLAYRLDFLLPTTTEETKPRRATIVLSKISPVDQFGKIKGELEAYLSGFNQTEGE